MQRAPVRSETNPAPSEPRWLTRPVLAWASYDVASSTYIAIVPVFFGVFFTQVAARDDPAARGAWGAIAASALVIAGLLAPLVGAWADRRGRALAAIAAATAACVAALFAMAREGNGGALRMAALFVAAQVGYTLAVALYDSLLLRVASREHLGRVSGFGWACGFTGGIASVIVAIVLMRGMAADAQAAALPAVFEAVALLFAGLALPALVGLRGLPASPASGAAGEGAQPGALGRVVDTLRHWRREREVFRFLAAYYLLGDVASTLTFFIAIVVQARFGLDVAGMLWLALLYQVVAMPATYAFGQAADRFGHRRVIYLIVAVLAADIVLLAVGAGRGTAVVVVLLLGLVGGSLQAVCRSYLGLLVEPRNAAEIFGFNAVAGRLSGAVGPLLFGAILAASGSETVALLSLLPFLAAGSWVLATGRRPEARAMREAALR